MDRPTKTFKVVNSSINDSKNLPHEAFDTLLDPISKKINARTFSRDEIEETLDQELTVELARMLGGKFYGTGEAEDRILLWVHPQKKAQNLILSKYENFNSMGMGAIVQEAANTGRAIVSIDMNLEDGIRLGSVLKNSSSPNSLGVKPNCNSKGRTTCKEIHVLWLKSLMKKHYL